MSKTKNNITFEELGLDKGNISRNLRNAGCIRGRASVWSPVLRVMIGLNYWLDLQTYVFTLELSPEAQRAYNALKLEEKNR